MSGIFLTIEGIEGVGKTTAIKYIQDYLMECGLNFILTREPGGTKIAENIRQILLEKNPEETMTAQAELLLMFASRAQLVNTVINPALKKGSWVVSDRFVDASYAYQGGGRGLDVNEIQMLEKMTIGHLRPHKTILLDANPEIGLSRAKQRGGEHDRIEQERIDFFERVRAAYLARAEEDKNRFFIIDATLPMNEVHEKIKQLLKELITNRA